MALARACLAALLLATPVAHAASGGAPVTLVHSGYLLDVDDAPISAPTQAMTFRVFTAATDGTLEYEATCTSVAVLGGYYAVTLGSAGSGCAATSSDPVLDTNDLPADASRYLEVVVGSVQLSPRLRLETLPAAAVALDARSLGGVAANLLVDSVTSKLLASALPSTVARLDATTSAFTGALTSLSYATTDGKVALSSTGITLASGATISGDGSGLTNVTAATTYTDTKLSAGIAVAGAVKSAEADPPCGPSSVGAAYYKQSDNTLRFCNGSTYVPITGSGGSGGVVGSNPGVGPVATYFHTGGDQTFVVPTGVTSITVKLWGAGGGGGTFTGGAGGYTTGTVAVTPGETLTVLVGGGGRASGVAGYGGGGSGGTSSNMGGGGGGRSALRRVTSELLTAGGGGGANTDGNGSSGGNGGGTTGGSPVQVAVSSTPLAVAAGGGGQAATTNGGVQSTGAYQAQSGTQFQGGNGFQTPNSYWGGGGGGGYFGGGGGTGNSTTYAGGGGGGSGFIGGSGVTLAQTLGSTSPTAATTAASQPPLTGDTDYLAGAGLGGSPFGDGGPGLVVIHWAGSLPSAPSTTGNATHGTQTFVVGPSPQTFSVPAGVTALQVKAWGAAGGSSGNQAGGAGGYATAFVTVTPAETLTVIVGGGGGRSSVGGPGGFGGGGNGGPGSSGAGGGGGGRSALRRGLTELVTAGAGGGAAADTAGGAGGPGGGLSGGFGNQANGASPPWVLAQGGSQVTGGTGGVSYAQGNTMSSAYVGQPGSQFTGGTASTRAAVAGGGGGAGWYGGGGGNTNGVSYASGGGGGSSYVGGPGVFGTTQATSASTPIGSSGQNPPQIADTDYVAAGGTPGRSNLNQDGSPGLVVLKW